MINPGRGVMATEIISTGVIDAESVQVRQRIIPPPGAGEALVAIAASGVTGVELPASRLLARHGSASSCVPGCDIVGTVHSAGPNVNPVLLGRQVAALIKTGGWATHALVPASALVPALDGLDPAEVESLLVNGVAAKQILHRHGQMPPSTTILIHVGRGYGVARMLAQLAYRQNIRVIIAASFACLDTLDDLIAELVDADAPDLVTRIRALAQNGLGAAFHHKDDARLVQSFQELLAPGGNLVSYTTSVRHRKSAPTYNFWAGYRPNGVGGFRQNLREDLTQVLNLLATHAITAPMLSRLPCIGSVEQSSWPTHRIHRNESY